MKLEGDPLLWVVVVVVLVGLVILAFLLKERWLSWIVGAVVTVAVLATVTLGMYYGAQGDGIDCGFVTEKKNLASTQPVLFKPADPKPNAKIAIAMDDLVNEERKGSAFVALVPTKAAKKTQALPGGDKLRVGAFILGGTLSDGTRSIGFPVKARATRSRDGRGLDVEVCVPRPEDRSLSRPGNYKGTVRVAGRNIAPADVPVEVKIKAARTELIIFAAFIAALGAALGAAAASSTKAPTGEAGEGQVAEPAPDPDAPAEPPPADAPPAADASPIQGAVSVQGTVPVRRAAPDEGAVTVGGIVTFQKAPPGQVPPAPTTPAEGATAGGTTWAQRADRVLQWIPFVSGMVAGIVAAIVVYSDDPTFGAQRGADMAKLLAVTFTAATGGLAVTAPPAGAARAKLPT